MNQKGILERYKNECLKVINQTESFYDGQYCPPVWDGILCWRAQEPDTLANQSCPAYLHLFNPEAFATRRCMENGTWFINSEVNPNSTWTNFTTCGRLVEPESFFFTKHLWAMRLIARVGYSFSLCILLVAFFILAFFKKLRCPRNNLHIQLFLSFIMRALLTLVRYELRNGSITADYTGSHEDQKFTVANSSDVSLANSTDVSVANSSDNVDCIILMSIWHYFLMANYCWILMEGLYLHNLVFLSMFTDTSGICKYIVLGWGLPVVFIIPWAVVRATLKNFPCWKMHESYFWILRVPLTVSIVVNFALFLNITRVLFLKMFSSEAIQSRRYRYSKWFKSTLVLIPLFGAHYTIFVAMPFVTNQDAQVVWMYLDQTICAFQGLFVALLYCFFNGEVQAEIRKICQRIYTKPNQPLPNHHSLLTQSLTYLSKGRSSIQSLHSMGDRRENCTLISVVPANKEIHLQVMASQLSPKASGLSLSEDVKPGLVTTVSTTELDQHSPGSSTKHKNSPMDSSPCETKKSLENTEYENLLNEEFNHRNEKSTFQRESIL